MSQATDLLKREVAAINARIDDLVMKRDRRIEALKLLGGPGAAEDPVAQPPATVERQVDVKAPRGPAPNAEIEGMIRAAGRANVEAVAELMRQAKRMSQRDLASQLDLAPGTVSKAVRALEAAGRLYDTGEKEGRSPLWSTVAPKVATTLTSDEESW